MKEKRQIIVSKYCQLTNTFANCIFKKNQRHLTVSKLESNLFLFRAPRADQQLILLFNGKQCK